LQYPIGLQEGKRENKHFRYFPLREYRQASSTQLVLDALDMALWRRRPSGVIHHSDQGSQYTSLAFGKRCREADVRPSMGSVVNGLAIPPVGRALLVA
jgi:transposase InsO family protein